MGPCDWMMTYTGVIYHPHEPKPEEIRLADIAHALSMICRYGGHARWFYSVAEHGVLVSRMVPPAHALEALLHDAAEAYIGDMIIPLKQHGSLTEFKRIERMNDLAMRIRFGLPHEETACVKQADAEIRGTEWPTLMMSIPGELEGQAGPPRPDVHLKLWCPTVAEDKFIERYRELTAEQGEA